MASLHKKIIYLKWLAPLLALFLLSVMSLSAHADDKQWVETSDLALLADEYGVIWGDEYGLWEFHVTLTGDYVLEPGKIYGLYGMTIPSGVTLTIPAGSLLQLSCGPFLLEEGAKIIIQGEPDTYLENEPDSPLRFYRNDVELNGTIESSITGFMSDKSYFTMRGTIHCALDCAISHSGCFLFEGGSYCVDRGMLIRESSDMESFVRATGGSFSPAPLDAWLTDGYEAIRQADGSYLIEESSAGELSQAEQFLKKAKGIIRYNAKDHQMWIALGFLAIVAVYMVYMFLRQSLKSKLISLIAVAFACGFVWYSMLGVWEKQKVAGATEYSEDNIPSTEQIKDEAADTSLAGLEVYAPGIYLVGRDLEPGEYYLESDGTADRFDSNDLYVYFSDTKDFLRPDVFAGFGRAFLELEDGQYVMVKKAYFVRADETASQQILDESGSQILLRDGEFIVGRDIAPGVYTLSNELGEYNIIQVGDDTLRRKDVCWDEYISTDSETFFELGVPGGITETPAFELKEGQHVHAHLNWYWDGGQTEGEPAKVYLRRVE